MAGSSVGALLRAAAVVVVAGRVGRILRARPALDRARPGAVPSACTVVVPARDEADRIRPLLAALRGAPGVVEVIVVDDRSTDETAEVAAAAGARVVRGSEPPSGWAGKTWALHQGVGRAATDWVVTMDADVEPDPVLPASLVGRAVDDGLDLVSVAGRADVAPPTRWLHAAMVHQLVCRFGPPGTSTRLANGQCTAARRDDLLAGLTAVRHHVVEDVALARHLASIGARVAFLDATDLLVVRPARSFTELWWGWGRSLGLRGVEAPWRQVVDVAAVGLAVIVPPIRLLRRRADVIDVCALALRFGTLVGTRRAHAAGGVSYWSSPLADPFALAATAVGLLRPSPMWRGRRPPVSRRRGR